LIAKLPRLMSADLPQSIAPKRLAQATTEMHGQIALDKMPRLKDILHDNQGLVDVRLAFAQDENSVICITGEYQTRLKLVCQRCLGPFESKMAHHINVGVVFARADIDTLTISLSEFIEDEILLGLPIAPLHPQKDCAAEEINEQYRYTKENPFSVLKNLKPKLRLNTKRG